MRHTETYFGLENIDGKITADSGATYLEKYADMNAEDFDSLVFDIENWKGGKLSDSDIEDLKEILQ